MNLLLERFYSGLTCTLGKLFVDETYLCFTLEDLVREEKIMHETAIPAGEYVIKLEWSNRFKHHMPRLKDVPGFEGILIHSGNTNVDTSGCILVGMDIGPEQESILRSRVAYDALMSKLNPAFQSGETVTIEVR